MTEEQIKNYWHGIKEFYVFVLKYNYQPSLCQNIMHYGFGKIKDYPILFGYSSAGAIAYRNY